MGEFQKSQAIRLLDLPLGAFMMYVGFKGKLGPIAKGIMIKAGLLTILYNLNNYLKNEGKPGLW